jgi:DNA (cytosine-5)-methyltransferase 1
MKLLDLFCGAGGCSVGYHRAGFDVVGIDIKPQPNYPFEFIQSDVFSLEFNDYKFLRSFDFIHASPPCQAYVRAGGVQRQGKHPRYIEPTRAVLIEIGRPYILENVVGAPLIDPLLLCGTMFGLAVIRHRLFEINASEWVYPPMPCNHKGTAYSGAYCSVYSGGHRPGMWGNDAARKGVKIKPQETVEQWQNAMGIDWMDKAELIEAIPPAYTEWIGKLILK